MRLTGMSFLKMWPKLYNFILFANVDKLNTYEAKVSNVRPNLSRLEDD